MTVNGSEPQPQPQEIVALFLVVLDLDGSSRVVLDENERFISHRLATPKDIYPALANCLADWQGMKTAEAVFGFQMQAARQAAEAQEKAAQQEG
jgi:ubiquinone biosynthesis protein Coq4